VPIETPDHLREHLQTAIGVELATIPPYLYAMYSIADPASTAARYVRSVATEEMLHAVLMANVLLGIGGEPRFYDAAVVPRYPMAYPHRVPLLPIHLAACSTEVVSTTFLAIERPHDISAPPQEDDFTSLGQFYAALQRALVRLDAERELFATPQLDRQVLDPSGYLIVKYDSATSGGLVAVDDLAAALRATDVAIHQGEGLSDMRYADPGHRELTHHAKFLALVDGTVDIGEVLPTVTDPTVESMPPQVRPLARLCNATYSYTYVLMDRLTGPETTTAGRHHLVAALYGTMVALLGPMCRALMSLPADGGQVWGPTFELHRFHDVDRAEAELDRMAPAVLASHPELAPVLHQLSRLPSRPADYRLP
jgi:hypothetical protein